MQRRKPSGKKNFDSVMSDFNQTVRLTLGVMVGTNTTLFVTPADVAQQIVDKSGLTDHVEVEEVFKRTTTVLSQAYSKKIGDVYRTRTKISPQIPGRKAQYGYRVGPALAPIRTAAIREEERLTAEAVAEATSDPVAFLNAIKSQSPMSKLNGLLIELVNEIQNRITAQTLHMAELSQRMKEIQASMGGTLSQD